MSYTARLSHIYCFHFQQIILKSWMCHTRISQHNYAFSFQVHGSVCDLAETELDFGRPELWIRMRCWDWKSEGSTAKQGGGAIEWTRQWTGVKTLQFNSRVRAVTFSPPPPTPLRVVDSSASCPWDEVKTRGSLCDRQVYVTLKQTTRGNGRKDAPAKVWRNSKDVRN